MIVELTLGLALAGERTTTIYAPAPTTFDAVFPWSLEDRAMHALVHDRLVHPDGQGGWWSRLVEDLQQEATTATVRLRGGTTWHDGHPIDAGDLCFTISALAHAAGHGPLAAPGRARLASCVVRAGDPRTADLVLWTDEPVWEALAVPLLPQHRYGDVPIQPDPRQQREDVVGCGPYRVQATPGGFTLTAHLPGLPFPTIAWANSDDPRVAARVLAGGTGDAALEVPPHGVGPLRAAGIDLHPWDTRIAWSLALDTQRPPLDRPDVRRALDIAIDREALRAWMAGPANAGEAHPWPMVTGPWPHNSRKRHHGVEFVQRDLEQAARLLTSAGLTRDADGRWLFNNEPMRLVVAVPDGHGFDPLGLPAVIGLDGIEVVAESVGSGAWVASVLAGGGQDHHHAALVPRALFPTDDPAPYLATRGDYAGWFNVFDFSDPDVDMLLQSTDESSGRALHGLLADLRPHLYLFEEQRRTAWRPPFAPFVEAPHDGFSRIDQWVRAK